MKIANCQDSFLAYHYYSVCDDRLPCLIDFAPPVTLFHPMLIYSVNLCIAARRPPVGLDCSLSAFLDWCCSLF